MTTERFVKKLLKHIVILVISSFVILGVGEALGTIIGNYIALEQMTNSDTAFIMMETYNKVAKPLLNAIFISFYIWNIGSMIFEVYNFIKMKNKEKENEEL